MNDESRPESGGQPQQSAQDTTTEIEARRATDVVSAEAIKSRRTLTMVVYILQALSFVVGITGLIAIIINYVKRSDMQGTWLASHFRWQIRTFWFGLLWGLLGVVLTTVWVGFIILFANFIWVVYRIVRGVLALIDNKPMYQS